MSSSTVARSDQVLWISKETPDRNGHGGQRRQYFQIRELRSAGLAVTCLTLAGEQDDRSLRELADVVRVRGKSWGGRLGRSTTHFIDAARETTASVVVIAHAESWALLNGRADSITRPVLVDFQNVNSKWYAGRGDRRLMDYWLAVEHDICTKADAVSVTSAAEADALRGHGVLTLLARSGIDVGEWPDPPSPKDEPPTVATFGSWWWEPNARGLEWFVTYVWPLVRERRPDALLRVAGPGDPPAAASLTAGVVVHGWVESLARFVSASRVVLVCPIDGPGTPVKFSEALASGIPVVATRAAAAGDPESPARLFSDPAAMADSIIDLFEDETLGVTLGAQCRAYALAHCTWRATQREILRWVDERRRG